jgi:hypothetical protein
MIRMKKIRDSARGEDCTVCSPWCNHNPETVVFAHYGEPGEKGMGIKPDDSSGCYACSSCHDWLDGRVTHSSVDANDLYDKIFYWFRAMRRTWKLLIENGILK